MVNFLLKASAWNQRNEAELLLDNAHKHACRGGVKRVPSTSEDLHQSKTSSNHDQSIQTVDGKRQCVILVDTDSVRHTVARVPHKARHASRSVQRETEQHGSPCTWRAR